MAARDESVLQNALPAVEQALGYSFLDRHLLLTALTHRSFCNETDTASGDFDELEWLGDSVLQLAISSWLFRSAKGSRRSSGQLSATRQRFVDAGACEAFAVKLNLLPFLRIGHGQPVRGTKILADCFEAVLGAVYVDAGGCSDLEPIHVILGRVIPSYEHGRRSQEHQQRRYNDHQHQHHRHRHHPPQGQHFHHPGAPGAPEAPKPRAEEPRKLMNLAHRLAQMAKRGAEEAKEGGSSSVSRAEGPQRNPAEVLREFDERLRGFQQNVLRGGELSFGSRAFAEAFGETVAQFFAAVATGNPETCALLDSVLDGSSMLRKHFADTPPGSERVVMEVVPVPSELRLQTFTVVEFLQANVLHQHGGSGGPAGPAGANPILQLIRSAPHGDSTIALLSSIVADTATNLLLNARQRAVISSGLALSPPPASFADPHVNSASPLPRPAGPAGGRGPPHPGLSPPAPNGHCIPGRKRSPPPRGGLPWGGPGPRGRGGGWGRGGGGRGGRGGGRLRGGV